MAVFQKFRFDKRNFHNIPNLRILNDWRHLYEISSEYEIILSSAHIAPKTRYPIPLNKSGVIGNSGRIAKCPVAIWDPGGADILTAGTCFADYFFVKGQKWKEWLVRFGFAKEKIFVTGSPHYDNYLDEFRPYMAEKILDKEQFYKKYELDQNSIKIFIMPSNPGAHKNYFHENMINLKKLYKLGDKFNIEFLIKTHPHDYVSNEREARYSGIYKRSGDYGQPQYDYLKKKFPNAKILDSQDHFSAMKYCDKLFNMSGSHVAWESYFTDIISCSLNYEKQPYYVNVGFLPSWVKYPDNYINYGLKKIEDMLEYIKTEKEKCKSYFKKEISILNILNSVKAITQERV